MTFLTVHDAADYLGVTNQCIYLLLKQNRIKALRHQNKYQITKQALENYLDGKWSRQKHFSNSEFGVKEAAKKWGITEQQVYYLIYHNLVPFKRIGSLYILNSEEIAKCYEKLFSYLSKFRRKPTKSNTGRKSTPEEKRLKRLSAIA